MNVSKLTVNAQKDIFNKLVIDNNELLLFKVVFLNMWFNIRNENGIEYSEDFLQELMKQSITVLKGMKLKSETD